MDNFFSVQVRKGGMVETIHYINYSQMAQERNIKKLHVICPGFISDCLETLEEINMEAREDFLEAGGSDFKYIPCLNFSENAIKLIHSLVLDDIEGWGNNDLEMKKREEYCYREKKHCFWVRKSNSTIEILLEDPTSICVKIIS